MSNTVNVKCIRVTILTFRKETVDNKRSWISCALIVLTTCICSCYFVNPLNFGQLVCLIYINRWHCVIRVKHMSDRATPQNIEFAFSVCTCTDHELQVCRWCLLKIIQYGGRCEITFKVFFTFYCPVCYLGQTVILIDQ